MTITERLKIYIDEMGLNDNQLTVAANLSVGLIGRAIKNNSGLNSDTIEKILSAYPDLNPNWLIMGEGSMTKNKIENFNDVKGNSINGNSGGVNANVTITNADVSNIIDMQLKNQEIESELIKRLEQSQNQISSLIDLLKNK
jgi:hypothetical protein